MQSYIPYRILTINEQVEKTAQDESFLYCMKLVFDWANQMGIKGQRVFSLHLETPNSNNYNPLRQHKVLWCKIECTEEERKAWEKLGEEQVVQYVRDLLNEE